MTDIVNIIFIWDGEKQEIVKNSVFWDKHHVVRWKSTDVSEECLALLATSSTLVSFLAFSSNMKMVICSTETLVDFQQTTWRYIPEDKTLHNNHCENPKSCQESAHVSKFQRQEMYGNVVLGI
jgi:hypothetical protein